jgi:DNA-binding Lrp family transcriptional regulator
MIIQPQNQNPVDRATEIKRKILAFLEKNGPSLPIPIARETGISSLFSSAFLSEMLEDGTIKISKLKVGGSPLYFMPNQEAMLENFIRVLPTKEKEAFTMLKEKQILKDINSEPAIRVALRNIKDFAFPVIIEHNNEKLLFWRYMSVKESDAIEKIRANLPKQTAQIIPQTQTTSQPSLQLTPKQIKSEKQEVIEEVKNSQKNPKSFGTDFSKKIEQNLMESGLEILERLEAKKKEYVAKILVNSQLGKTSYLCIAKDKKKLTENDLVLAVQKAQSMKLPVLLVSQGTLSEKGKAYLKAWEGMIKFSNIT